MSPIIFSIKNWVFFFSFIPTSPFTVEKCLILIFSAPRESIQSLNLYSNYFEFSFVVKSNFSCSFIVNAERLFHVFFKSLMVGNCFAYNFFFSSCWVIKKSQKLSLALKISQNIFLYVLKGFFLLEYFDRDLNIKMKQVVGNYKILIALPKKNSSCYGIFPSSRVYFIFSKSYSSFISSISFSFSSLSCT